LEREGKWTAKEIEAKASSLLATLISILMLLRLKRDPVLFKNVLQESLKILD
jgi:hypothetical protein